MSTVPNCIHKSPCLAQPVVVISNPCDINLIFTPSSTPRCQYIGWFHPFIFLRCFFVLVFHRSVVFYMSCPSWFCQFHVVCWRNQLKFRACILYSSPTTQVNVTVKHFHYRTGQALRVPGGWGSQISRQSAHEGGKVVSPTHRPSLPPGNISGTHFC